MDTIFVAFNKSDEWHKYFLKKGFGHCSVLIPCVDSWLEIDPCAGILQFNLLTDTQLSHYTKLLRIQLKPQQFKSIYHKFFTCVSIVEYVLGKNTHSITPYSLYKKLTGNLKEIFNTEEII